MSTHNGKKKPKAHVTIVNKIIVPPNIEAKKVG